jgi:anhydro-N-acetylmuramic acid kinase
MKNKLKVLGMMSGTSLDGLDLAFCEFWQNAKGWNYKTVKCEWKRYPSSIVKKLAGAHELRGEEFVHLDSEYGVYLGQAASEFLRAYALKADFIASHGHTVFHQPAKGFTSQIGNGVAIHTQTGVPVIYDFRTMDVMLGGQGAPLVPIGDELLFSDTDICLNLGGIANLSARMGKQRKAFDICFCNMVLNKLVAERGKKYDKDGVLAAAGEVDQGLLKKLSKVYRDLKGRPSLGREIFSRKVEPIFTGSSSSLEDKLATAVESAALEIARAAKETGGKSMLCTGGGAFNSFLMSRILEHCGDDVSVVIPDEEIVKFKEAIVFGFLGVLRVYGNNNALRSVTGASRDSSGGVIAGQIRM